MNPYAAAFIGFLVFLLATEENATHWLQLQLSLLVVELRGHVFQSRLRLRLWVDRLALTSNSLPARIVREQQLRAIRNNPAYAELFAMTPPTPTDET